MTWYTLRWMVQLSDHYNLFAEQKASGTQAYLLPRHLWARLH